MMKIKSRKANGFVSDSASFVLLRCRLSSLSLSSIPLFFLSPRTSILHFYTTRLRGDKSRHNQPDKKDRKEREDNHVCVMEDKKTILAAGYCCCCCCCSCSGHDSCVYVHMCPGRVFPLNSLFCSRLVFISSSMQYSLPSLSRPFLPRTFSTSLSLPSSHSTRYTHSPPCL